MLGGEVGAALAALARPRVALLEVDLVVRAVRIQIWNTPLMFIFTISDLGSPYFASNSSVKMASSNVFEHSRPMLNRNGLDTLPALRSHIVGGDDVWQPIPTSASRVKPSSLAWRKASGLAQYV